MDFTLGLDFGTHQSKLCLQYHINNDTIIEFIEFDMPDGNKSPLFPSIIQINKDETISVGHVDSTLPTYRYFKLASFSNAFNWTGEISSDTLCVWYLTYLMLRVKEYVYSHFDEVFEESVSIQMGVPISGADNFSIQVRNHAYKLMVSARELMDNFLSTEDFLSTNYKKLQKKTVIPKDHIREKASDYGFIVIPEAYAGLKSLTENKRLTRGNMHLLVDIGGGSTDIAFFTIKRDATPNIHIVKSMYKGLNYVFELYRNKNTSMTINQIQDLFSKDESLFSEEVKEYNKALNEQLYNIINLIIRSFKPTDEIPITALTDAMINRPIVYSGGGSMYSTMIVTPQQNNGIDDDYFSDIKLVNKRMLSIPHLKNEGIKDELYPILAISYGLSIPLVSDEIDMSPLSKLFDFIRDTQNLNIPDKDYGLSDD